MLIVRKMILALTGLFICLFITVHLGGNLILLLPEAHARPLYNAYSSALGGNPFIKVIAYVNYVCFLFHIVYGTIITFKNRKTRKVPYKSNHVGDVSDWSSQNMGLLGALLFAFLVIHLIHFWYPVKFSDIEPDLYSLVSEQFQQPLSALFYTLAMIPLALHLSHGFSSAFRSLGLYNARYLRWVTHLGHAYAWVVSFGFALIPIIMYARSAL
ncbi:MAG: succinate dehydrogenase cytochrome b subunit [Oligoflexus sp.]|nr:succinate dehydrogenase cytochrome b subunit [Oligoflexus sp.]